MQALRWLLLLAMLVATPARASGPVERLLQLLVHPSQPSLLVVRYGAGASSHGFLFSRDGGRSFQLMCSANVTPGTSQRVSTRAIPSTAATALDTHGAVMFAQYGTTWIDDGTGCTWSDEPALHAKWPLGFARDGHDRLWSVVSTEGSFEIWRRDDRAWTNVGPIRLVERDKAVLDASIVEGTRLYASVLLMGAGGVSTASVLRSDDDGLSWAESVLPKDQERLSLLAVDPTNKERLLAAIPRDGSADTLLLSVDGGASFRAYFEPRAVGGVTFDDTGRVYLADEEGLFTAAQLGEPLQKLTAGAFDCVLHAQGLLYACAGERFGVLDPASGELDVLLQLDRVTQFLSCPGKSLHDVCKNQLNAGPSWCCAGHYPFTPICGDYDVTVRPDNGRVFCGRAGRAYDRPR